MAGEGRLGDQGEGNDKWQKPGRLVKKDGRWQWITGECSSDHVVHRRSSDLIGPKCPNSQGNRNTLVQRFSSYQFRKPSTKSLYNHNNTFRYQNKNPIVRINPNCRSIEKFSTSIFVSNIPWKATVKDLWDACSKWGTVVDVFIASKKSSSGHRFCFVRFKNVGDVPALVSNIRTIWMGNFHLFADIAKFSRFDTRKVENYRKSVSVEVCTDDRQPVIGKDVEKTVSYADVLVGKNSVKQANKLDDCIVISEDEGMDYSSIEHSLLLKVKDIKTISDTISILEGEGFINVAIRYVGGRWVWLDFDSVEQVVSFKTSEIFLRLFSEFREVGHDFIPDERCIWVDIVGLPLAMWAPMVYKKIAMRWGSCEVVDMDNDGPMSTGKVCILTTSMSRLHDSFNVSFRNCMYQVHASEVRYWAPEFDDTDDDNSQGSSEEEFALSEDASSKTDDNDDNSDKSSDVSSTVKLMNNIDTRGVDVPPFQEDYENVGHNEESEEEKFEKTWSKPKENDSIGSFNVPFISEDCNRDLQAESSKVNSNVSTPPGFKGAKKVAEVIEIKANKLDAYSKVDGCFNSRHGSSMMESPSAMCSRLKRLGNNMGLELPKDKGALEHLIKGMSVGWNFK